MALLRPFLPVRLCELLDAGCNALRLLAMADDRIAPNSDLAEKEVALGDIDKESVPEAILAHGLDADEALKAFIGHEGEPIVLDEVTNRRLLRKIDLNIMPVCERVP